MIRRCIPVPFIMSRNLPSSVNHDQNTYPVPFITSRNLPNFFHHLKKMFLSSWGDTCPVSFINLSRILTQLPSSFHHLEQNNYPVPFIMSRNLPSSVNHDQNTYPVPFIMSRNLPSSFHHLEQNTYPVPFIFLSRIFAHFLSSSWGKILPSSFHHKKKSP